MKKALLVFALGLTLNYSQAFDIGDIKISCEITLPVSWDEMNKLDVLDDFSDDVEKSIFDLTDLFNFDALKSDSYLEPDTSWGESCRFSTYEEEDAFVIRIELDEPEFHITSLYLEDEGENKHLVLSCVKEEKEDCKGEYEEINFDSKESFSYKIGVPKDVPGMFFLENKGDHVLITFPLKKEEEVLEENLEEIKSMSETNPNAASFQLRRVSTYEEDGFFVVKLNIGETKHGELNYLFGKGEEENSKKITISETLNKEDGEFEKRTLFTCTVDLPENVDGSSVGVEKQSGILKFSFPVI